MTGLKWTMAFVVTFFALGGNAFRFRRGNATIPNRIIQKFAIVPGTLWCGPGSIADNYDDLGFFRQTDSCCRTHDHCPSKIDAGGTLGNLTNDGFYTRSECSCDVKFHQCLKNVGLFERKKARSVGRMYFDVLRPQCFMEIYPIVSCLEYGRFKLGKRRKCAMYKLDETKNKTLQWMDGPDWLST